MLSLLRLYGFRQLDDASLLSGIAPNIGEMSMLTVEARLTSLFEGLERDRGFSGAVLVSQERRTLFEGVYGFASRQLNVPNTLATRFHIASLTKMFTAMAALILVEGGRIALKDRPATYVPALSPLDERITLHHLLSHTSGLRDVYEVPNKQFEARKARNDGMDLLAYIATQPQTFEPGERWSYTSTGYLMVAYVLEQVTGTTFETLLRDLVLTPLAMSDTGVDRPRRVNPGRAYGHTIIDGQFANAGNDALSPFHEGPPSSTRRSATSSSGVTRRSLALSSPLTRSR